MIRKILSCGQTGVELGVLDIAIKLGIPHGGWTCRGKRNEDGLLADIYNLTETLAFGFDDALQKNIAESDGTLVISRGGKTSSTQKPVRIALKLERQFLHVDLSQYSLFEAASLTSSWLFQKHIRTVFVTGLKASEDANIYIHAQKVMETAFYLGFVKSGVDPQNSVMAQSSPQQDRMPQSVQEAVGRLKGSMSLKDRTLMANLQPDELFHLNSGLGEYIKQSFGLYANNEALLSSCAKEGHLDRPLADEACAVIIRTLWEELRHTHKLRIVK